jgi:hypothetical protein
MIDLENVHGADQVFRASQPVLNVPGQIPAVKKSEAAKGKQNSNAVDVVGSIFGFRLEVLSARSNLRRTRLLAENDPLAATTHFQER